MSKKVLPFDDRTTPLMNADSLTIDETQLEDYVLVFSNPVDTRLYTSSKLLKKLDQSLIESEFLNFFSLDEKELILKQSLESLKEKIIERSSDMSLKDLTEVVLSSIFRLLQEHLGLLIKPFLSADQDQIFVLIRASDHNLKVQADLIDYRLQLNEEAAGIDKFKEKKPFQLVLPYAPFEKTNGGRSLGFKDLNPETESLYQRYNAEGQPRKEGDLFKMNDRVRLVKSMLTDTLRFGSLYNKKILEHEFPLHSFPALNDLKLHWASISSLLKPQPLDKVRDYFGEEIALYFAWLEFYTKWLCIPSLFGFLIFILLWIGGGFENTSYSSGCLLAYSLILAVSSTVLDQLWVRKENIYAWKWGLSSFAESEEQRAEYKGEPKIDEVSGKLKKIHKPKGLEKYMKLMGYGIILFFIALVIAAITAIFTFRDQTRYAWGATVAGVVNALQIKAMNLIYRVVAKRMTDWENNETNTVYNDSLTFKLFCFQFVNSYASLFYIAFIKAHTHRGCSDGDCMGELRLQLITIYLTNFFLNIVELGVPYLKGRWKIRQEEKRASHAGHRLKNEEKQALLENYDKPLDDYMEIVIGFGYVILFGVAFPVVPILALVLAVIEIRVDAWKLCNLTRRPFPVQNNSIGIWHDIIQTVSFVGVSVNLGIAFFTFDAFQLKDTSFKWILFVGIEHGIFFLKFLLSYFIPDVPKQVQDGIAWSERIVNQKVYGVRKIRGFADFLK
jgi:hypothetical protein